MARRENKPAAIDAAMKRFEADVADLAEEGDESAALAEAAEKEREDVRKYMEHVERVIKKERESDKGGGGGAMNDNYEFVQRPELDKLVKSGGPFRGSSYSAKDVDAILTKTLAWEGPEMEKPVVCLGASGFIAALNENDELDKSDVFECTAMGKDRDSKTGTFLEGQILKADGLKVKDLKIVEILSKTRFRLSTSVLLNSREVPGNNYCAETPPTLVKRYNVLSFRAAKIAYDEDKRTGGLKDKDKAGGHNKEQSLGLSTEQVFEFRLAFDIVAEEYSPGITYDSESVGIPEDRIHDVFLALGYTMMDHDMEFILENSYPTDGLYTCDELLECFDQWKQKQLSYDNIKRVFNTLVSTQKLPGVFRDTNAYAGKIPGDANLPSEALKNALNTALHLDGDSKLKLHEIKGVEDEISSNPLNHITIKDFIEVFRS